MVTDPPTHTNTPTDRNDYSTTCAAADVQYNESVKTETERRLLLLFGELLLDVADTCVYTGTDDDVDEALFVLSGRVRGGGS